MKKQQIKNLVQKHLLETIEFEDTIIGKLNKKSLGFNGYITETILTGTTSDANDYAKNNNLEFNPCSESRFGGHYKSNIEIYEFCPTAEFYGELMEHTMSVSDSFSRISGNNDKILNNLNEQLISESVTSIIESVDINENTIQPILENIKNKRTSSMFDPSLFTKFSKIIVKDAQNKNSNLHELKTDELDQVETLLIKFLTEQTCSHKTEFAHEDQSLLKNYNKLFLSKNF